jgi:metal-responsive CopG/Arc/MetJ family transcriptional regulator
MAFLTERLPLLLDSKLKQEIEQAADKQRLTASEWIRRAAREKLSRDRQA